MYDLAVKNHACYQANGLMVSNSDAFGEFAVNAHVKAPEKAPEPELIPEEHIGKLQVPAYNQRRKKGPRRV